MKKVVVVINHWGGVPRTLHGNVVFMQSSWCKEAYDNVSLSSTDGLQEYIASTAEIWRVLNNEGVYTVALGATGYTQDLPSTHHQNTIPDPRFRHVETHSVWQTSVHDGAFFPGPALLHDTIVLQEAIQVMKDYDKETPMVLCVNLLSCRDTLRSRFGNVRSDVDCCVVTPVTSFDTRLIPRSLNASVVSISARFAESNARRYGEEPTNRTRPEEFVALLNKSLEALHLLQTHIDMFLESVFAHECHVAMMTTRSFSMGEHRCRDDNTPLVSCVRSFWCSTCDPMPNYESLTLVDLLKRFVHETCGIETQYSFHYRPTACVTRLNGEMYTRVECRLNDHRYVCLGSGDTLLCIFDADDDPCELNNIYSSLSHLHAALSSVYLSCVPSRVVPLARLRDTADLPDNKLSLPPSTVPAPTVGRNKEDDFSDSTSMFSERDRPPSKRSVTTTLRAKESRLSKMHR